jgi:hypothetical protein
MHYRDGDVYEGEWKQQVSRTRLCCGRPVLALSWSMQAIVAHGVSLTPVLRGALADAPWPGAHGLPERQHVRRPVSLKRLLDQSPWLQFSCECQRF